MVCIECFKTMYGYVDEETHDAESEDDNDSETDDDYDGESENKPNLKKCPLCRK